MSIHFHMRSIFEDVIFKQEITYSQVRSAPLVDTSKILTGYVHTLDQGTAIFITDDRKPFLIPIECVLYYKLATGDRIQAKVNFSSEYNNYVVIEVNEIQHVTYDQAPVVKSNRSFNLLGNSIALGTSALLPVTDNSDIVSKVAQILPQLPADVTPILLSFDGRPTNFDVPTTYFTKPNETSRDKLMTCLLTFFYAKQQADVGKHIVLIIDSLDKMFTTFNDCMQKAGMIDPNMYSSAAVMDYENILCSSSVLKAGGSLTIIGFHQRGTSPQMIQISDRLTQIMDSILTIK
ncbi:MAG: hypothetical protein IJ295_03500 [Clostridia bacterium]|nr:hypothetical protein [Clostridia bacterium]